jgi:GT2 family glycosyltransferase
MMKLHDSMRTNACQGISGGLANLTVTVLVPTYNRQSDLRRCLEALSAQTHSPNQVLLVVRKDDTSTMGLIPEWKKRMPLTVVHPEMPGQVNALNAGLSAARSDVVAITDDDAAPRSNWVEKIVHHFSIDSRVGGVGGRDWIHLESVVIEDSARQVGRIRWYGRLVGNHHLGIGPAREVDFLKGANMSYRRSAIKGLFFDPQLRGRGAQVTNDMAFSLGLKRQGWKLIYDPDVAVDHFPAPRFDDDQRDKFQYRAAEDAAFNQYWTLATSLSPGLRRRTACGFQTLVGSRAQPGYLHLFLGLARFDKIVWQRWRAAHRGRKLAYLGVRKNMQI